MKFIEFDVAKCDECFKCLRVCPTKAIAFTKNRRHIIDDLCIKCGLCQLQCPHGALTIKLDLQYVKNAILAGKRVVASIAPSFAGAFSMRETGQMAGALRTLGFFKVEETARGAEIISELYEARISESKLDNIITSCCPSSNDLIQRYYPEILPYVIPVVSPMLAHGYDLKTRYGDDVVVVFIGPCLAKKAEAVEIDDSIDAVITFKELENWLSETHVMLDACEPMPFDTPTTRRGKAYPLGGSLWKKDLKTRINPQYQYIHVDGIENCRSFLDSLSKGDLKGYCAELNICTNSCINGPDMPTESGNVYKRRDRLENYVIQSPESGVYLPVTTEITRFSRDFKAKDIPNLAVNEHQIAEVLIEMGKYTEKDQLNCGACGYASCYEKAVAIVKGHSSIDMCLDRLRHKAESLQAIIFDNSPNAICILDSERRIQEVNPAFNEIFNASKIKLTYWPIAAFIDDPIFNEISENQHYRMSKKIYVPEVERTFFSNVVSIQGGNILVGIFTDITDAEHSKEELERVKRETMITCQAVIEKQMRVAQEIASLLGETTAETKVGLNKLKQLVLINGGE
jgi:iron only hydrogenase large subunit-like protein/uncharacterized Fe-S cluster-containing protein